MDRADRPLAGRTVLVTRPAGRGVSLVRGLKRLGATVVAGPTITLLPPVDDGPARRAIAGLDRYDWLLFTSPGGVRFFLSLTRELGRSLQGLAAGIAAIGPGTARELQRGGLAVAVVAEDSRGEGLSATLGERAVRGQSVLLVQPEVARPVLADSLRAMGLVLDAVAFYRNAPAPGIAEVAGEIQRRRFDVVVFTSPSTLQRLLEVSAPDRGELLEALRHTRIVAIGRVTARALEEVSLQAAALAPTPSDRGIVEAVCSLF